MNLMISKVTDERGQAAWWVEAYDARSWYGQVAYGREDSGEISWTINQTLPTGLSHDDVVQFIDGKALENTGTSESMTPSQQRDSAYVVPQTVWLNGDDD